MALTIAAVFSPLGAASSPARAANSSLQLDSHAFTAIRGYGALRHGMLFKHLQSLGRLAGEKVLESLGFADVRQVPRNRHWNLKPSILYEFECLHLYLLQSLDPPCLQAPICDVYHSKQR